jgi:hypothetical protein
MRLIVGFGLERLLVVFEKHRLPGHLVLMVFRMQLGSGNSLRLAAHPAAHPDKPGNRAASRNQALELSKLSPSVFRRTSSSPMTSTATPISTATEQEHYQNDNQDQFHGISPLMAMALFAAYQEFNGVFDVSFRISLHPS